MPFKSIQSAQNEKIKQLGKYLAQNKYRKQDQVAVLEGNHLLSALLDSGQQPMAVYVPEAKLNDLEVMPLLDQLPESLIYIVADGILKKISALRQGEEIMVLYNIVPPKALPIDQDCVVLENVQDPGNVGTILRSALASGVKHIVISTDAADVYSPKVIRSGMGAHFSLQLHINTNIPDFLSQYQGQILATSLGEPNVLLYDASLQKINAWVVGNEGAGVSMAVQKQADLCVKIPMAGQTESLNVAMATTICLFEQMRQRFYKG